MSELIQGDRASAVEGPAYVNDVVIEIERATKQAIESACATCPLAHWEISIDDPRPLNEPLSAPGLGKSRWIAECFCRVRHTHTARLEPDPERSGTLRRAAQTKIVFRCSDRAGALADWQSRNQG